MKSLYDALNLVKPDAVTEPPSLPDKRVSARTICRDILNSRQYRESILQRIIFRELPPAVECRLWDYAYGKPVEKVEIDDKTERVENLTSEQLERKLIALAELARRLRMNDEVHQSAPDEDEADTEPPSVH